MSPRIAICFFGITRSLGHTIRSIEEHVLKPAATLGEVHLYAHFFQQARIDNVRSGESGALDPEEYRLLASDWLRLEEPETCLETWHFEAIKRFGDFWEDGFKSLRNLVHQLHSMRQVTLAALAEGADVCLFCRPDLRYHDSLAPALQRAVQSANGPRSPLAQIPVWQSYCGQNDRFALCTGEAAIRAYGTRIEQALAFCQATGRPLHSERLLAWTLDQANIPIRGIAARASRVRLDGSERIEHFLPMGRRTRARMLAERLYRDGLKRIGIAPPPLRLD